MKISSFFLFALLAICSCSTGDPGELDEPQEPQEVITSTESLHYSYQMGFSDVDQAQAFETNHYFVIAIGATWKDNSFFIPDEVEENILRRNLVHSYEAYEFLYKIFTTSHYDWVTYNYYAYYSCIVEWDTRSEISTKGTFVKSRDVRENLKVTTKYLCCTEGTPAAYIPTDTSPKVTTYPDYEGEWRVISNGSGGGGGGSGGDSVGGDDDNSREYVFHCSTTGYIESLNESETLYIYKSKQTGEYRVAYSYYSNGLEERATERIHSSDKSGYRYMIIPFGIATYFNFSK
ncbi:MAG: hypothetical protein LBM20_01450 [Rikenellaceae bacterium]|jgi:hypothetical protein|nr:hypothetical protein [Rikenellaceae bacterium]